MSVAERAERAKMLVHFQESFLRQTHNYSFPKLNFIEVATKWLSGKSVKFTGEIFVSPDYQFFIRPMIDASPQVATKLTSLFEKIVQPISNEEVEELVRGYINCDVFLESHVQEESNKHMNRWYDSLSDGEKQQLSETVTHLKEKIK